MCFDFEGFTRLSYTMHLGYENPLHGECMLSTVLLRNATATTDLIVKALLCSTAAGDALQSLYDTAQYNEYLCEAGPVWHFRNTMAYSEDVSNLALHALLRTAA